MSGRYVKEDETQLAMPNAGFTELMAAVLHKGAPFRFQAAGFSMSPFIRSGDVITIAPAPARVRFGDVVAFESPSGGKLVVHRVVGVCRDGFIIKGDNSPSFDVGVLDSNILGRVTRVERGGKRVRLGSGIERVAVAVLSRRGWLRPSVWMVWRIKKGSGLNF